MLLEVIGHLRLESREPFEGLSSAVLAKVAILHEFLDCLGHVAGGWDHEGSSRRLVHRSRGTSVGHSPDQGRVIRRQMFCCLQSLQETDEGLFSSVVRHDWRSGAGEGANSRTSKRIEEVEEDQFKGIVEGERRREDYGTRNT